MTELIDSIRAEYVRYKGLAEGALAQLRDDELSVAGPDGGNSVAIVCWHVSGNLRSRFTEFLTADGEKPWRNREEEFDERTATRAELMDRWAKGWQTLFDALDALTDDHLRASVRIGGQTFSVHAALHRSLAHTAYHVGQIVYVAKALRGAAWRTLSIPRVKKQDRSSG